MRREVGRKKREKKRTTKMTKTESACASFAEVELGIA